MLTDEQRQIAKENGIHSATLWNRLNKLGWDIESAITVKYVKQPMIVKGVEVSDEQLEEALERGITRKRIHARLYNGWTLEDTLTKPVREIVTKNKDERGELIKVLGRMKYLNRIETEEVPYNPEPLMKKLKVTWDDIKEVKC